jgi:glycerol-3-phosphate O-acyltransferase
MDLLGPGGDDLTQRRREFAGRLHDDVARLIVIDEIDAASRREAIGVEP